jgi:DDE family transposase
MGMLAPSSLQEHFATLTDPRCPHAPNSRHLLMDILVIAVCAVIGRAEGWEDIEEYGLPIRPINFHIPPHYVVERFTCLSEATRGEDLQVEHPIWFCRKFSSESI